MAEWVVVVKLLGATDLPAPKDKKAAGKPNALAKLLQPPGQGAVVLTTDTVDDEASPNWTVAPHAATVRFAPAVAAQADASLCVAVFHEGTFDEETMGVASLPLASVTAQSVGSVQRHTLPLSSAHDGAQATTAGGSVVLEVTVQQAGTSATASPSPPASAAATLAPSATPPPASSEAPPAKPAPAAESAEFEASSSSDDDADDFRLAPANAPPTVTAASDDAKPVAAPTTAPVAAEPTASAAAVRATAPERVSEGTPVSITISHATRLAPYTTAAADKCLTASDAATTLSALGPFHTGDVFATVTNVHGLPVLRTPVREDTREPQWAGVPAGYDAASTVVLPLIASPPPGKGTILVQVWDQQGSVDSTSGGGGGATGAAAAATRPPRFLGQASLSSKQLLAYGPSTRTLALGPRVDERQPIVVGAAAMPSGLGTITIRFSEPSSHGGDDKAIAMPAWQATEAAPPDATLPPRPPAPQFTARLRVVRASGLRRKTRDGALNAAMVALEPAVTVSRRTGGDDAKTSASPHSPSAGPAPSQPSRVELLTTPPAVAPVASAANDGGPQAVAWPADVASTEVCLAAVAGETLLVEVANAASQHADGAFLGQASLPLRQVLAAADMAAVRALATADDAGSDAQGPPAPAPRQHTLALRPRPDEIDPDLIGAALGSLGSVVVETLVIPRRDHPLFTVTVASAAAVPVLGTVPIDSFVAMAYTETTGAMAVEAATPVAQRNADPQWNHTARFPPPVAVVPPAAPTGPATPVVNDAPTATAARLRLTLMERRVVKDKPVAAIDVAVTMPSHAAWDGAAPCSWSQLVPFGNAPHHTSLLLRFSFGGAAATRELKDAHTALVRHPYATRNGHAVTMEIVGAATDNAAKTQLPPSVGLRAELQLDQPAPAGAAASKQQDATPDTALLRTPHVPLSGGKAGQPPPAGSPSQRSCASTTRVRTPTSSCRRCWVTRRWRRATRALRRSSSTAPPA